jgi:hypothetical protein
MDGEIFGGDAGKEKSGAQGKGEHRPRGALGSWDGMNIGMLCCVQGRYILSSCASAPASS